MIKYCYCNGKIVPINKAKISINDIAILRGFGAFDFFRSYQGKLFLLGEHYKRLKRSLRFLGIKTPLTEKELRAIAEKLITKNKLSDATFRVVVTGGNTEDGISFDPNTPTVFLRPHKLPPYPPASYTQGVKLITYEHQREIPEAKTINYPTMMKLQKEKKSKGAMEILYTFQDQVLEGSACNFFMFKGKTLITAKDNILYGTRRRVVLTLAKKKFKVEKRLVKLSELKQATEAFITSTTKNVMPVVKIDDLKIGTGKVGHNTQYLIEAYKFYVEKHI